MTDGEMPISAVRAAYEEPRPIRLPRPGAGLKARRAFECVTTGAKRTVPALVPGRLRQPGRTIPRAIRETFEDLGATYVKFGQVIASAPAIIPEAISEEFRSCLDEGPAVPFASVRAAVERDTRRRLEDAFAHFERTPLASASIAVVHRARLHDGREVVVKVLRPQMAEVVAGDLALLEPVSRFFARQGSEIAYNAVSYLVGLRSQVAEELDLRNEVRTMAYFRALYSEFGLSKLVIPEVVPELSGPSVLTMEYLDGVPVDDLAGAEALGVDPAPLIGDLLRAWVLCALGPGVFHADIHAGNLLVLRDGRLGVLDWGIVARLEEDSQHLFRSLVEAALGSDEAWEYITDSVIRAQGSFMQDGYGLSREEIRDMTRQFMQPILTKPMSEVSMAALFMNPERAAELNQGIAPPKRNLRERWQWNRAQARAIRIALDEGLFEAEFQRWTFLAAKQLLYLERYARMYLPDEALLGDHEFLRGVLEKQRGGLAARKAATVALGKDDDIAADAAGR
jgi:predicted unusual protein kinase regulating ubiquinone biosynthesis (AarF/ABC1/UbiB family)